MLTIIVSVVLGDAEINQKNLIFGFVSSTDKKIAWLDISVNDSFCVDCFDSLNHLNTCQTHRLQIKPSFAFLKQIFQTWPQKIHNHDVKMVVFVTLISSNIDGMWQ